MGLQLHKKGESLMSQNPINWLAVLVSVLPNFIIGAFWYSPLLFVKPWMKIVDVNEDQLKSSMVKALLVDFIGGLVMAFTLVHILRYAGAKELLQGLVVTGGCWLGFAASVLIGSVTYEHRPFKYFAIVGGYRLVSMLSMGAILTLWS